MPTDSEPWWKGAVIYQIYPRSFCDTDGDGVGDLDGIRRHLDHIAELGADGIWLSPFFRSPMADFGYDVSDYCDVDPTFGTLDDFDRLVDEAHARDLRVLIDWVPNHTSDQHPWFAESRSSRTSPKRDWYVWRDGKGPGVPPNNWTSAFTGDAPAWTWDEGTEQWYLHCFLPAQPDLDWNNPEVVEAMHGTLRFWLDRGVDGFRMDVIHFLGKDPALPDNPPDYRGNGPSTDHANVHEILRGIRGLLDGYENQRTSVGEVYILSTARVAEYYGNDDELHMAFNFPPLWAAWDAAVWRKRIERVIECMDPRRAWPTWVLSNHDVPRHRTRYGTEARARAAAVLLLGLRGTPFLYAGEELGLEDAVIPPDRVVDPGGRDGCRAPIPWTPYPARGWATEDPWLPWPPDASARAAAVQAVAPSSVLSLYRRLLTARRASPALRVGDFAWLPAPDGVLAWERTSGGDRRVVAVSFVDHATRLELDGVVEVSSDGAGEAEPFTGQLSPDQAVVLR